MHKYLIPGLIAVLVLSCTPILLAQTPDNRGGGTSAAAAADAQSARIAKLELQTAEAKSSADNAWMLMSSALVLMMTGPGWHCSTVAWCGKRTFWAP